MKQRIAVLLILGLMPWTGLHAQQTATTTFIVKTTVQAVCTVTATDLNFGDYNAQSGGAGTMSNTVVKATCTPGTTYNIALGAGGAGNIYAGRQMASGPNKLNYQLYRNGGRTDIWGNTIGTDTVTGSGSGLAVDHTVYGTIPGGQVVPAGTYQDIITVTISY